MNRRKARALRMLRNEYGPWDRDPACLLSDNIYTDTTHRDTVALLRAFLDSAQLLEIMETCAWRRNRPGVFRM